MKAARQIAIRPVLAEEPGFHTGTKECDRRGVNNMPVVKLKEGEAFESAMRRFKKQCEKAGILSEVRKREHYEKPSVKIKRKRMAARKRALKKLKKLGS